MPCPSCFFGDISGTFSELFETALAWSCQMLSDKPLPGSAACSDRAEISPRLPRWSLRKPVILFFISVAKLQDPGICSFSSYIPLNEARINAPELAVRCQLKPLKWTQKSQPSLNREMLSLNLAPVTAAAGKAPWGDSSAVITYVNRDGVVIFFHPSSCFSGKGWKNYSLAYTVI